MEAGRPARPGRAGRRIRRAPHRSPAGRPARRDPRPAPLRSGDATSGPLPQSVRPGQPTGRSAAQARWRVRLRQPLHLGHRAGRDGHRNPSLRQGDRAGMGPAASRLTRRAAWIEHDGPLPFIEGTVIRLAVEKLPSGGVNKRVWLWWSGTRASAAGVERCWQSFLRRFDLEHTFRLLRQTLGWTKRRLRSSDAADRWTWLVIAAYAQLRLARPLATDLRRPWERPTEPHRLTPAHVRRGFRNPRTKTGSPARAPKPSTPVPGTPLGSKNRRPTGRPSRRGPRPRDRRGIQPSRPSQSRHETAGSQHRSLNDENSG